MSGVDVIVNDMLDALDAADGVERVRLNVK